MKKRHVLLPALALVLAILSPRVQAQESPGPELVRDINRGPSDFSAAIQWIMPVEQGVVFAMKSIAHGEELWSSDGTPGGTRLLMDILPGSAGSHPDQPRQVGDKVVFVAYGADGARQLWITDGTEAGTAMLLDTGTIADGKYIIPQGGADHGIFFNVEFENAAGATRRELWFSDGSSAGTHSLGTLSIHPNGGGYDFNVRGRFCYFLAYENEVWRSDGSVAGTVKVMDGNEAIGHEIRDLAVADTRFYFSVGTGEEQVELWTASLDGSNPLRLGSDAAPWSYMEGIVTSGDAATVVTRDYDYHPQLVHSDGTVEGTRILPLVHRDETATVLGGTLVPWNGVVYFVAESARLGGELWRTDGTPEGTNLVKDIRHGAGSSYPWDFLVGDGYLYFQTVGADGRRERWRTAGTAKSTKRVARHRDNQIFGGNGPLIAFSGGDLYYDDNRSSTENALWKTRPSDRGVQRLTTPDRSSTGSAFTLGVRPPYQQHGPDLLAFVYLPERIGPELWRIDDEGRMKSIWTPLLKDFQANPRWAGCLPGKSLFVVPGFNEVRAQLWVTDGTARGTRRLARQAPYEDFMAFAQGDSVLYYSVHDIQGLGMELWRTDGTVAGTLQIRGADGTEPKPVSDELVVMNDIAYFMARDGAGLLSLWRSDGTPEGTAKVFEWDLNDSSATPGLAVVENQLAFAVGNYSRKTLWRSDGTTAGTYGYANPYLSFSNATIGRAIDLNGLQLFQAGGWGGSRWYRSNGTAAGTYVLPTDGGNPSYWIGNSPRSHAIIGSLLYYPGTGAAAGEELWVTDGTAAGTHRVKDIRPGAGSSSPREFVAVGDQVYFTADTSEHGRELWKSDGTEAGTVLVADLEPGLLGSEPSDLELVNGKLYFTAERRTVGRELYVLEVE